MKHILNYCRLELSLMIDFLGAGGISALLLKSVIFLWLLWVNVAAYFVVVWVLAIIDLIVGTWASLEKGNKFSLKIFRTGLIDKACLYNLLLLSAWLIESFIIKKSFHYPGDYILMFFSFLISSYELGSIVRNTGIIRPEWTFLQKISSVLDVLEQKAMNKVKNINE